MQPSHAVSRRATSGHSFRWHFVLVPAFIIFVISIPVLAFGQRGGRSSPWGSARIFRSGANVSSSGQDRLYNELQKDSGKTNTMHQRSVQQVDAPHTPSPPMATYSSNFLQSPQPTWPGLVSFVALPSTPAITRTPSRAEANSNSFRGSAPSSHLSSSAPYVQARPNLPSSGFTGVAPLAPQSDRNAVYNGFTSDTVLPRNDASRMAPEGTPHRTDAPSYSLSSSTQAPSGQRLYGTYTDRAGSAHHAEGGVANSLTLSPTAQPIRGSTGTPSAFSPTEFSSGGGSRVSTTSSFGTTAAAFTFTPWGSTTSNETLVNSQADNNTGRNFTTVQSNHEPFNSSRPWTVGTAPSMSPLSQQRQWPTASTGGSPLNEDYQISNSVQPGLFVPSPGAADVVYTGFEPRQPGSSETSLETPSRPSETTDLRNSVTPSSRGRPALDDSRQYTTQFGSGQHSRNNPEFSSVRGDSVSSSVRIHVEIPDNAEEKYTALPGSGSSSLVETSLVGEASLQQDIPRPFETSTQSNKTQAPSEYGLGPILRDEDPPLFADEPPHSLSAGDTNNTSPLGSACQAFQDRASFQSDNPSKTGCVESDGTQKLGNTEIPSSVSSPVSQGPPEKQHSEAYSSHGSAAAEDSFKGIVRNDSAKASNSNQASLTTTGNVSELPTRSVAPQDGKINGGDEISDSTDPSNVRVGYIPLEALTASSVGAESQDGDANKEQLLYGDLTGYMADAEDPWVNGLAALGSQEGDVKLSVTTTSTTTTQTYPPFYNPYNDNLDVDDIPDSPYHNYKWAVDPFPSTYSTHSRLENYESEFNNRYYHEEKTAPNITWEEYTRRRSEVEDARKREAELQNEGKVGLIESSDTLFQGLIGYPNRGRMSWSQP